jgi:ABC-2 type transport system ATP-binding protein
VLVRQGTIVADGTAAQVKNLASGRTVRATLPPGDRELLAGLPPAAHVEYDAGRVTVRTADSDSVVRYLLNTTGAHDLEVVAHNLEEAFVALTADEPRMVAGQHALEGDLA